jgi:hypothetical protein
VAQNKVIMLTEKHPAISAKGVCIQACRQNVILKPFEPVEVQDDVTARTVIQFAGRAGLTVEIYDGRKHNRLVAANAQEKVRNAELEDLDFTQPGMLAAVAKPQPPQGRRV